MILSAGQYRQYAGLDPADPPTDAEIERALWRAEVFAVAYIRRVLQHGTYRERFYRVDTPRLVLSSWPVDQIVSITLDGNDVDFSDFDLHHADGILNHDGRLMGARTVEITYIGGFYRLPNDLAAAILTVAEATLAGGGGGMALQQGTIKKETVHGVTTIEYFDPRDSGSDESITGGTFPEYGPYVLVLDRYRRPLAIA